MSALADFHFLRPLALLLVLALPLAWLALRSRGRDPGAWREVVDAQLLPHLVERVERRGGRAGAWLAAIGWTIACLALAGPAWEREPVPLHRDRNARVLALELAPTMLAQDERPSRLERARYKIADILERSRERQTALIAYAGEAFVVAPLTDDIATVQNLVDALDPSTMPVTGNATADAIRRAVDLIEQAGLHRGEVVLVADSAGAGASAAARKARAVGVKVSVLGVGSPGGAPIPLAQGDFLKDERGNVVLAKLDEAGLRAVADAGGGRYARITADVGDLEALFGDSSLAAVGGGMEVADGSAEGSRWRDRGPWLLLLLLPLALAGFRRGWLMLLPIALLGIAPPAQAGFFADLWQRRDQQAAEALREGDARRAAEVAPTPAWSGAAAYRAGDYAEAGKRFAEAGGADAAYNRGNALAQDKQYEEALSAYDEALELDPSMEDAKANRDAVEAFLKQSQPPDAGDDGDPSQGGQAGDPQQGQQPKSSDGEPSPGEQSQAGEEGSSSDEKGEPSPDPAGGEPKEEQDAREGDRAPPSADGQSGEAQAGADEQQQQALSKAIDEALQHQDGKPANEGEVPVPVEDETTRERKQALEHWLRRVPDDPGGLLRRKFQLEYQRRQQRGGDEP